MLTFSEDVNIDGTFLRKRLDSATIRSVTDGRVPDLATLVDAVERASGQPRAEKVCADGCDTFEFWGEFNGHVFTFYGGKHCAVIGGHDDLDANGVAAALLLTAAPASV